MEQVAYLPPLLEILLGPQDLRWRLEEALRYVVNIYGFSLGLVVTLKPEPRHFFYQSPRLYPGLDPRKLDELFESIKRFGDLHDVMNKAGGERFDLGLGKILDRTDMTFRLYPLVVEEEIAGFLNLARESGLPDLGEEEKSLLSIMVRQIVMELTRELVLEREQELARESSMLVETGKLLTSNLELENVFGPLVRISLEILGVSRCVVFVLDEMREKLELIFANNPEDPAVGIFFEIQPDIDSLGEGGRLVHDEGKTIHVANALEDPRVNNDISRMLGIVSFLGVPIISKGKTIGSILVDEPGQHHYFSEEDIRILEGIASFAAIAIVNARLYQESREQQERVADLMLRLAQAREEERSRISRELHDSIAQTLLEIIYKAEGMLGGEPGESLEGELRGMLQSGRSSLTELRRIITDLRPASVEVLGITQALRNLLERFAVTYHVEVDIEAELKPGRQLASQYDSLYDNTLYRLVQEALSNIARHAGASRVKFVLRREDNNDGYLEISDDGRGFDPACAAEGEGLGLVFMRERVEMMGGSLKITSQPGEGTVISIRVPMPETDGAEEADLG